MTKRTTDEMLEKLAGVMTERVTIAADAIEGADDDDPTAAEGIAMLVAFLEEVRDGVAGTDTSHNSKEAADKFHEAVRHVEIVLTALTNPDTSFKAH